MRERRKDRGEEAGKKNEEREREKKKFMLHFSTLQFDMTCVIRVSSMKIEN
jgi:hypothetical protein